ncbi:MAG TPA: IclR family transcriptional regulator [Terriglobales bacterium]|nr:IclR family transcriptional regulator [Terriglobales bacterium]
MSHSKTRGEGRSPYHIQVLDRALSILEALSQDGPDLTLAQMSESLGLHKSTAHRLIMVLGRNKLVEKNSQTGKYRLGLKLFELGTRAVSQLDLRERARPFLERVVLETGETVHLCIYDDGEVVYLDKVEPRRSVRLASSVGRRNPAYCTAMGKAIMAYLPENQVEIAVQKHGLRPFTRKTIGTMAELKSELVKIRETGYAIDNEENEEGVCCVGSVVRDFSGDTIAAISVSGPTFRVGAEKISVLAKSIISAADGLSKELGFHAASGPRNGRNDDKPMEKQSKPAHARMLNV